MPRKTKRDADTRMYLLGRVRVDHPRAQAAEAMAARREASRNAASLRSLQAAAARLPAGSARRKSADRAVRKFRNDHGL